MNIERTRYWLDYVRTVLQRQHLLTLSFHLDGVPKAFYFGQEGLHNILVIDLLGPSLEDLFDMCGRQFSTKTVAMLAKQMVSIDPLPLNHPFSYHSC
jgi:hypothetical protein